MESQVSGLAKLGLGKLWQFQILIRKVRGFSKYELGNSGDLQNLI